MRRVLSPFIASEVPADRLSLDIDVWILGSMDGLAMGDPLLGALVTDWSLITEVAVDESCMIAALDSTARVTWYIWDALPDVWVVDSTTATLFGACVMGRPSTKLRRSEEWEDGCTFVMESMVASNSPGLALCLFFVGSRRWGPSFPGPGAVADLESMF